MFYYHVWFSSILPPCVSWVRCFLCLKYRGASLLRDWSSYCDHHSGSTHKPGRQGLTSTNIRGTGPCCIVLSGPAGDMHSEHIPQRNCGCSRSPGRTHCDSYDVAMFRQVSRLGGRFLGVVCARTMSVYRALLVLCALPLGEVSCRVQGYNTLLTLSLTHTIKCLRSRFLAKYLATC